MVYIRFDFLPGILGTEFGLRIPSSLDFNDAKIGNIDF